MYRTDKQFMKNPATASSRIYVGNLAETVVHDDMEEKFSKHGKILGMVVQRGFGFIQFETEEQAHSAIENEHGSHLKGRALNVKQAVDNAKAKAGFNSFSNQKNNFQNNNFTNNQNQKPNFQSNNSNQGNANQGGFQNKPNNFQNNQNFQKQPVFEPPSNNFQNDSPNQFQKDQNNKGSFGSQDNKSPKNIQKDEVSTAPKGDTKVEQHQNKPASQNKPPSLMATNIEPPSREPPQREPPQREPPQREPPQRELAQRDPPPREPIKRDPPLRDPSLQPSPKMDGPPPEKRSKRNNNSRHLPRDFREDYRDDIPPYYDPYPPVRAPAPYLPPPERNDCEIIVVAKALTEYAEYIEQRLKSLGLIVDLLFPNEDVPIGRVLANISSRGCLYAILVTPQNEEHRSLTLNILHGIPEEHRNMPAEDACLLITRNFEAHLRGEKFASNDKDADKMALTTRHPEHIQVIINLLAENRLINTGQYDKLLNYLQEKRELQSQFELSEGIDSGVEPEVKNKQAELQSRIMNILNKKADDVPKVTENKSGGGAAPLLNDPSVQKALDSLLQGDMFKNLS